MLLDLNQEKSVIYVRLFQFCFLLRQTEVLFPSQALASASAFPHSILLSVHARPSPVWVWILSYISFKKCVYVRYRDLRQLQKYTLHSIKANSSEINPSFLCRYILTNISATIPIL